MILGGDFANLLELQLNFSFKEKTFVSYLDLSEQ